MDGIWGKCDAFIELEYKNQTKKSVVVKNSLDPDWKPEEIFEFDLSKGDLVDLKVTLKDWNRLTSVKTLGTTLLSAARLQSVMGGEPEPRLGAEFFVNGLDGEPLKGKDGQQTFLVLKLSPREGLPRFCIAEEKAAADVGAPDVGAINLFNTPSKSDSSPYNLGPEFVFVCDIDEPTRPVSNGSSAANAAQHTPNLTSSTDHAQLSREAPRRIRVQDRADDFWTQISCSSSPSLSYASQPQSLYTDFSQNTHNEYKGARPRLARIRLADRGIIATSGMYLADHSESGLPSKCAEVGQDATFQGAGGLETQVNSSLYLLSTSRRGKSTMTRERELRGAGRVLQDYRYESSQRRLEKHYNSSFRPDQRPGLIKDGLDEWQEVCDPSTGKIFFVCHATKQFSWVDPRSAAISQTAGVSSMQSLYASAPSKMHNSASCQQFTNAAAWVEQSNSEEQATTYNQDRTRLYATDAGVIRGSMNYPSPPPSSSNARRHGWAPYVASTILEEPVGFH